MALAQFIRAMAVLVAGGLTLDGMIELRKQ